MPTERRQKKSESKRTGEQRNFNQRMTIAIVGAGRLGTALGIALARRGYAVETIVARSLSHARRAASLLPSGTQALSAAQLDSLPPSDLLLITTPDDQLAQTAARLADTTRSRAFSKRKGKGARTALHCSGALSSDILSPLAKAGWRTGAMHPLVSISEAVQGAERLRGAYFCVEGDPQALRLARTLVRDLEGQSFAINKTDKALYHAAAVMASGHVVALFDIALKMLARCGLTERKAQAVLLPLLESITENLKERDPAHSLTGTFARADTATMRRHLEALRSREMRDALEVYRLLGRRSIKLAKKIGVDVEALKKIESELEEDEER
jgi:predicted short-subunit dehydrogenase-like oxidoreductase (DUF2520 family)